jgi:uncharacterized protein YndB with AHSA1/START domain
MSTEQVQNAAVELQQLPSEYDRLMMLATFPHVIPETLFDYWITPELICRWWPPVAEIEPREGGEYHLSWPKMNWNLRGRYTTFERGKALAFSWKWDHISAPARQVTIDFEALPNGGTQIILTHGFYTSSAEDQEERNGHLEGWTHFLGELQQLRAGE